MTTIHPSANFYNHHAESSHLYRENRQPVCKTVNRHSELELLHMLSDAEKDVRTGHIAPIEESFRDIRESLES